jgi:zinc transport system ATP-binding protein
LHKPTQGQIRLFGQPLEQFKDWHRIGYVPQKSSLNPLFPATVYEVVKSGLYVRKTMFTRMTKEMLQKVEDAMQALGIENLRDSLIGRLSGGQQQRVFLARALVNNPDLLILDEPTIGIDQKTQESFFQLIFHMHQHHNITFLLVSHDLQMVHNYMGQEPKKQTDRLQLYVRHSHDLQDCRETDLTHTLRHFTNGGL